MVNETPEETPPEQPPETPAEATAAESQTPPEAEAAPAPEASEAESAAAPEAPPAEETPPTPESPAPLAEVPVAPELTLGQGTPEEEPAAAATVVEPVRRGKIDRFGVAMGTGRRKTSVARVRIKSGDGKLTINGRALDDYFCVERDRLMVEAPLRDTEQLGRVDVWVRVNGGGTTGQAGAIVLGIARALEALNPSLHHSLSDGGYLTRDSRMVERKKYGYKKARKSFQFSKR